MTEFLARVCAEAADRVAAAERAEPLDELRARAAAVPAPPPFGAALAGGVIAEVKRASPSRGVIAPDCDAISQARAYVAGGASAVSVLTEPAHFRGSLTDLAAVADAVAVPVLRKDFVISPYQLFEARAAGAAAALLLAAALDDAQLTDLLGVADEAGIEALIETHDADEVARVTALLDALRVERPPVVGINARDLRRLAVDRGRFAGLVGALPDDVVVVAESGVAGPRDVGEYIRAGADAVLVGTHLMLAGDPVSATRMLVDAARARRMTSTLSDPS